MLRKQILLLNNRIIKGSSHYADHKFPMPFFTVYYTEESYMKSSPFLFYKTVPRHRQLVTHLSMWRLGFDPRPVHMGYVVDKVTLYYPFLQVLQFFHQYHFTNECSTLMLHSPTMTLHKS